MLVIFFYFRNITRYLYKLALHSSFFFILLLINLSFTQNTIKFSTYSNNEQAQLQININDNNNISGTLTIIFKVQPKDITESYIILPFRIGNPEADTSSIELSPHMAPKDFTILNLLIGKGPPNKINIFFPIIPSPFNSYETDADLNHSTDFLSIENRPEGNVFHFRFDTQLSDQAFGTLTEFAQGMIMISKITVVFPKNTSFYTIPPLNRPWNILDGPNPGTLSQDDNIFTTSVYFYQGQHLWINYRINSSSSPPPNSLPLPILLVLIAQALSLLIPIIIGLPPNWFTDNFRLKLSVGIMIAIPLLVFFTTLPVGINYFFEKPDIEIILIPGAVLYVSMLFILILRIVVVWMHPQTIQPQTASSQPPTHP